jgi:DNA-3-methyladenine glycosylase II
MHRVPCIACYNRAVNIECEGPFDFQLSWSVPAAFTGHGTGAAGEMAMWWEERPTIVFMRQVDQDPPTVEVRAEPKPGRRKSFMQHMRAVLNADLSLKPFYQKARRDPKMAGVVKDLKGLKPFRPPDLFQMMVIAVTEQQISMAAAARIRQRIVTSFGSRAGDMTVFPRPEDLASRTQEELRSCGLSGRKAEYLIELSNKLVRGELDAANWEDMPDEDLIQYLKSHRGIGEWTAEYILVRGLGRLDVVPASDLGVRKVVGRYLGGGGSPSPDEVRDILEPWSPWRGLLAFYLLAHGRRSQMGLDQAR